LATACVFCGAEPTTREHILPRWFQKYFPAGVLEHSRSSAGVAVDVWDAGAFTATSRVACASCNSGWMSRLELRAEPVVSALALGQRMSLDPFLQPVVAAWAYKTALVFETAQASDSPRLPTREYVDPDRNHPTSSGEPTDTAIYKATLTVGSVLFHVAVAWAGDGSRQAVELQFPSAATDKLRRIWRLDFSFDWPPEGTALTEAEFIEMSVVAQDDGA
jgi:hypothetical protein